MPLSREGACDAPSWQQRAPALDKLGPECPSGAGQVARIPQLHGWRSVPWGPAPGGQAALWSELTACANAVTGDVSVDFQGGVEATLPWLGQALGHFPTSCRGSSPRPAFPPA